MKHAKRNQYPLIWVLVEMRKAPHGIYGTRRLVAAYRSRAEARAKWQNVQRWSDRQYRIVRYEARP